MHSRNFHLSGAQYAWKSQPSLWKATAAPFPAQILVDAIQKGLEIFDFGVKNYLEGQLLLQKNTQLPRLACGVRALLGMCFSFDFMTV